MLSPSTESYDCTVKIERYKEVDSLEEYLLASQEEPRVEHWHKGQFEWTLKTISGPDSSLSLPSLDIRLSLTDVYEGIFTLKDLL